MTERDESVIDLFGELVDLEADVAATEQPLTDRPHPGQQRLAGISVVNWGTFSGYHQVTVPARGFLLTGPSGSGKSSLLDAISVVLVPPKWLDLNAAARDAASRSKDRTLYSYVRGAWSQSNDESSGELAVRYLRPGATWSAVSLEYDDGAGHSTTLVRVFSATGAVTNVDGLTKINMIVDGPFDLRSLEGVVQDGVNVRSIKAAFDPLVATSDYSAFADKFTRRLGIAGDGLRALRLLHKTQSTKGLSHLDTLLRDFMLDEPATFAAAQRTVEQFQELEQAYRSVQEAEAQVAHLLPSRELYGDLQGAQALKTSYTAQRDAVGAYRSHRAVVLLRREIEQVDHELVGLRLDHSAREKECSDRDDEYQLARDEHHAAGGGQMDTWRQEIGRLETDRVDRSAQRQVLAARLSIIGADMPRDPAEFAALVARAADEITELAAIQEQIETDRDEARDELKAVDDELGVVLGQLQALRRQTSNLDQHDLALRDRIAEAIGVSPSRLPFVAELVQVRDEDAAWRGAIERLLAPFAHSVVVPEALYAKASAYIDATHLGRKLLYNRVPRTPTESARSVGPQSVVRKLEVAASDHAEWLNAELSRRYDYTCAESLAQLQGAERAITVHGQVRHNRTRHEKDDRHRVDDERQWVLGFDNARKRELFEREAARLTGERNRLLDRIAEVTGRRSDSTARKEACQAVANTRWLDVDTDGLALRIESLQRMLDQASRQNADLARLDMRLAELKVLLDAARAAAGDAQAEVIASSKQRDALQARLQHAEGEAEQSVVIDDGVRAALDERFASHARSVTAAVLSDTAAKVTQTISRDLTEQERLHGKAERELERLFAEFRVAWPAEAADLTIEAESAPEFLAILERIEHDGLPAYLDRFRRLLEEQSTQNLAQLNQLLRDERKQIRQRIAPVNESLASVAFTRDTHLQLQVKDRTLPEVREFQGLVQSILTNALAADDDEARLRYDRLHTLVGRLGSSEPADRAWRDLVLDVRRHVEFIGNELAVDGSLVEVHTSGDGRSGGQRVKLVTFALAAALRYQLGGRTAGTPKYGTVVIDEAFDKADAEFTEVSMRVFEEFGFHMVLATPMKMVQTLSEFIGGAAIVSIRDRKASSVHSIGIESLA